MSRILFFLAFICLPVLGQQPQQEPGAPEVNEGSPAENSVNPADIAALIEALQTTVDYLSRQEAAENYSDDYAREGLRLQRGDLEAQTIMAQWTRILGAISIPSFFIALIGIIMLGFTVYYTRRAMIAADKTLIETRKAVTAAERGADATIEAALATELSAKATEISAESSLRAIQENRAWIVYTHTDVVVLDFGTTDERAEIRMHWKNTGRTPAVNAYVGDDHAIFPIDDVYGPDRFDIDAILKQRRNQNRGIVIAPDGTFQSYPVISGEELRSVIANESVLVAYSKCVYSDVYERTPDRETEIMVQVFCNFGIDRFIRANGKTPKGFSWQSAPVGTQHNAT